MSVVVTQSTGKWEAIRPVVYPLMTRYAGRCGADFCPIEDNKFPECPLLDKLRMASFLEHYDRVLFLDADVLVRPDAPSLFDLVPQGYYAAWNEGASMPRQSEVDARFWTVRQVAQRFGLDCPPSLIYYNAGVILFDRSHRSLFEFPPSSPLPSLADIACVEQAFLSLQLSRHRPRLYDLPGAFNQMPWNRPRNWLDCSFFVHYAGYPSLEARLAEMRRDAAYLMNTYASY